MYISPFWCGVITGAAAEFAVLIVAAIWYGRKGEK